MPIFKHAHTISLEILRNTFSLRYNTRIAQPYFFQQEF